MDNPKTLSAALCQVYKLMGKETLQDPVKLPAIFADVAPDLKAERAQLDILIKSGCLKKLAATAGISATERKPVIDAAIVTLSETYLMDPKKAEVLCLTYVNSLSGKTYTPSSSGKSAASANGGAKTGGTTSTNKTSGTTSTNKTGGTTSVFKPSGTTSVYKPSGTTSASKTGGTTTTNKTGGATSASKTGGATTTNKTSGATSASKPSGTNTKQPRFFLKFIVVFYILVLAFGGTYIASLDLGMATPGTNSAVVTAIVAGIMWMVHEAKKKKRKK